MTASNKIGFFEGQRLHALGVVVLVSAAVLAVRLTGPLDGSFLGLGAPAWFTLSLVEPILHQVYVWIVWRMELNDHAFSRTFGPHSFDLYVVGFTILFVARPLVLIGLALASRGTLGLSPAFLYVLALFLALPAIYTFYSVAHYFGMRRAYGIDHFDPAYREMPLVKKGIFRFTSNAMYTYGFLILWVPGLVWASQAALIGALFQHLYIWVHFYATESPDMRAIYGA